MGASTIRLSSNRRKRATLQTDKIARVAKAASSSAMQNAFSHGISVTRQQGENIVMLHPDGSTEFIKEIKNSSVTLNKKRYYI